MTGATDGIRGMLRVAYFRKQYGDSGWVWAIDFREMLEIYDAARATIADLTRQLAEARAETVAKKRDARLRCNSALAALRAAQAFNFTADSSVRDQVQRGIDLLTHRASLPPSNAAEPEAEEGTR